MPDCTTWDHIKYCYMCYTVIVTVNNPSVSHISLESSVYGYLTSERRKIFMKNSEVKGFVTQYYLHMYEVEVQTFSSPHLHCRLVPFLLRFRQWQNYPSAWGGWQWLPDQDFHFLYIHKSGKRGTDALPASVQTSEKTHISFRLSALNKEQITLCNKRSN